MAQLCHGNFQILLCAAAQLSDIQQIHLFQRCLHQGNFLGSQTHHVGQGLTDHAVQRNQNQQGDERPRTTGHGVDVFFLIELRYLLLVLLRISGMTCLQLLQTGLQTGGAQHALLALCHERGHNQVHNQCKKNHGHTVAAENLIELHQKPGKGYCNDRHSVTPIVIHYSVFFRFMEPDRKNYAPLYEKGGICKCV